MINKTRRISVLALVLAAAGLVVVGIVTKKNTSLPSIRGANTRILSAVCGGMEIECLTERCELAPVRQMECVGLHALEFLYAGGNCSMSVNTQGNKTECQDFHGGPPDDLTPDRLEEPSFIKVTNLAGDAIYYADFVSVMESFEVRTSSAESFPQTMVIHIFNKNPAADLHNNDTHLLQTIVIDTSCTDDDLLIFDRFGAFIIVAASDAYGRANGFSSTVPVQMKFTNLGSGPITMESLVILSSSFVEDYGEDVNFWNFTEELAGTESDPGADLEIEVSLPRPSNETSLLITAVVMDESGEECVYTDLFIFPALEKEGLPDVDPPMDISRNP